MTRRLDVALARLAVVLSLAFLPDLGCKSREEATGSVDEAPAAAGGAKDVDTRHAPSNKEEPPPAVVPTAGTETSAPTSLPGATKSVPGDGEAVFTEAPSAKDPSKAPPEGSGAPQVASRGSPPSPSGAKDDRISPTTKRTATGLPDAITGYSSWFRLGPGATGTEAGPHLAQRQAYIVLPEQENFGVGSTVKPPLGKESMLVLEQKEPGKDFISRIDHMAREETTWKAWSFTRPSSDKPFVQVTINEAECAACHSKSGKDSVYSSLKLE
jgi:hypothetical protein